MCACGGGPVYRGLSFVYLVSFPWLRTTRSGHWKDWSWPDDWTSTTIDGKRSAQFEHTLLVTETGVEILTARTAESPTGPHWFETAE